MEKLNYLFSKEGKKFAVVNKIIGTGQLICREVMIEKGTENEVLNNNVVTLDESILYNVPVESYQEKRINELKADLSRYEVEYNAKVNEFNKLTRGQNEMNKDFFQIRKRLREFCQDKNEPFLQLIDFVTGNFQYVVMDGYEPEMLNKDDFFKEMKNSDGMKTLVPYYASNSGSDRVLKIASYSDGSGSTRNDVFLFAKKEKAVEKFKSIIVKRLQDGYNNKAIIKIALENNIKVPQNKITELHSSQAQYLERIKKEFENQYQNQTKELTKIQELHTRNELLSDD